MNTFYSGKIIIKMGYINHFILTKRAGIYDNWNWQTRQYDLVNQIEHEWWGKFKTKLDNESNKSNHWRFSPNKRVYNILDYIYSANIILDQVNEWETKFFVKNARTHYFEGDWMTFRFILKRKNYGDNRSDFLYYALKLGGTGDINRISNIYSLGGDPSLKFVNIEIGRALNHYGWGKIDLKFRLHRISDVLGDVPLSIGKDEKYIIDTY